MFFRLLWLCVIFKNMIFIRLRWGKNTEPTAFIQRANECWCAFHDLTEKSKETKQESFVDNWNKSKHLCLHFVV